MTIKEKYRLKKFADEFDPKKSDFYDNYFKLISNKLKDAGSSTVDWLSDVKDSTKDNIKEYIMPYYDDPRKIDLKLDELGDKAIKQKDALVNYGSNKIKDIKNALKPDNDAVAWVKYQWNGLSPETQKALKIVGGAALALSSLYGLYKAISSAMNMGKRREDKRRRKLVEE